MVRVSIGPGDEAEASSNVIAKTELSESSTTSSSPTKHVEQVLAYPAGIHPDATRVSAPTTNSFYRDIRPHHSNLPLALYLLSFAPPFRPLAPNVTWKDTLSHPYLLYGIGIMAAILAGIAEPAMNVVYGHWTTGVTAKEAGRGELIASGAQAGWLLVIIGVIALLCGGTFLACFCAASQKLSERLRHNYLGSVLVQDAAFFDQTGPGEISIRASKDIEGIRTALGEKLGYLVWTLSTIISCMITAFAYSAKLGGVLFSFLPFLAVVFGLLSWANNVVGSPANTVDGQTASLIEQILSSVRIVQSFGMSSSLIQRLDGDFLQKLRKLGAKRSVIRSLEQAVPYSACFLIDSLAFWYGGILVRHGSEIGNVMTAFTCYVTLSYSLATVVPHITSIADAMVSLNRLRHHLEREPDIDIRDGSGVTLAENGWSPSYELENVTFAYPSRPTVPALKNVSVKIQSGAVVGVCGPSGSGKSTIAALLMREYDPETGNIPNKSDEKAQDIFDRKLKQTNKFDEKALQRWTDAEKATWTVQDELVKGSGRIYFANHDIRKYNLRWLRSQVAVVSQNPQIFTATVFENVAAGLTGTEFEYRPDIDGASNPFPEIKHRTAKIRQLCCEAMRKAQAWEFISKLPDGIDTMIAGGRTGVLSGGQRQRLTIARALVRKPACLLLDEATSALDADTEEKIRLMLERELAERGMTTIIIAHRLSTIAKADCIIVMKDGRVADQGRYEDLMKKDRPDQTFRQLAITQLSLPATTRENASASNLAEMDMPVGPVELQNADKSMDTENLSTLSVASSKHATISGKLGEGRTAISPEMAEEEPRQSLSRLFRLFATQKWFFLPGASIGLVAGATFPVIQWMWGETIESLRDENVRPDINTWSMWFMIVGIVVLFIFFANSFFLEVGSENITRKLKRDSVASLVKQEIAFFDDEKSSAGALTSAVSTHPANVGAATGNVSAELLIMSTFCLGSILLAFIMDWRMAVVCLSPLPLIILAGWLNVTMLGRYEEAVSSSAINAASYVNETIDSIKTVAALGRENEAMRVFDVKTRAAPKQWRYLIFGSTGFGMVSGFIMLLVSLLYYWSSRRLADGIPVKTVFAVFEGIFTAGYSGSRLLMFVGDYHRAISSFKAIQVWLRRRPKYANGNTSIAVSHEGWADGDIVIEHINMHYPQRPNHPALKDISLRIGAGRTHAFCGTSGSGKSSILALLQRFYDPSSGTITFGGVDHRRLALEDLRASMAYVSQDPVLFEGSIRWNLSLGALNPSSVTEDQIRVACEQAYIWDFVRGLEKGLDTAIGMKGVNLSGGQRQRLCIARALIRNPKILLLDEATSALDAESEKAVQMALDNASKGRTTITIAHRLSTIRHADVIHVIEDGCVKETGTHDELLRKRGRYLELVQAQL